MRSVENRTSNSARRVRSEQVVCMPTAIAGASRLELPAVFGACWSDRTPVGDELTVVRSEYRPSSDLVEEAVQSGGVPTLVATFALAGESGYVARTGQVLGFRAGRLTLAAYASSVGERRFMAGAVARQLRLVFSSQALERYIGEDAAQQLASRLASAGRVALLDERPIEPWCRTLLAPLLGLENLSPVHRQISALTLAAEVLRPLSTQQAASLDGVGSVNAEKLLRARDLMHAHMDRRLTIPYLCTAVGLNEYAFKQGFRKQFGSTPARYLLQLRMQRAWAMLESGARVSQTAYAVGYEHPANFSVAFRNYFGRTPKSAGAEDVHLPSLDQ